MIQTVVGFINSEIKVIFIIIIISAIISVVSVIITISGVIIIIIIIIIISSSKIRPIVIIEQTEVQVHRKMRSKCIYNISSLLHRLDL